MTAAKGTAVLQQRQFDHRRQIINKNIYNILKLHCVCVLSPPPEWCPGTEGYILSSRRNIALRNDSAPSRCPVLYSNAPTYFCGQTLTFK